MWNLLSKIKELWWFYREVTKWLKGVKYQWLILA